VHISDFNLNTMTLGLKIMILMRTVAYKIIIFGILGAYETVKKMVWTYSLSYMYFCPAYKNGRVIRDLRDRISELLLVYWVIGRKAVAILNCSAIRL
jgi:hypothetical protein